MTVIEATRNLGKAMQQDERFIRFAKAQLASDSDETLQNGIGEFNTTRMELDRLMGEENRDEEKIQSLNEKLRDIYTAVMANPSMAEYNAAKTAMDTMINDINNIIMQCAQGADPETCEVETHCSGSCASCGGCH